MPIHRRLATASLVAILATMPGTSPRSEERTAAPAHDRAARCPAALEP